MLTRNRAIFAIRAARICYATVALEALFLFGIFRLGAREFTVITLYTLAAYALEQLGDNLGIYLAPDLGARVSLRTLAT